MAKGVTLFCVCWIFSSATYNNGSINYSTTGISDINIRWVGIIILAYCCAVIWIDDFHPIATACDVSTASDEDNTHIWFWCCCSECSSTPCFGFSHKSQRQKHNKHSHFIHCHVHLVVSGLESRVLFEISNVE